MLTTLIKLAEQLDQSGFYDEAEQIDDLIKIAASFYDPNSSKNEGRHRLKDPAKFKRFWRRKDIKAKGISMVMGETKSGKIMIQAIRFDKKLWPEKRAREWWGRNKSRFTKTWTKDDWKKEQKKQKAKKKAFVEIAQIIKTAAKLQIPSLLKWKSLNQQLKSNFRQLQEIVAGLEELGPSRNQATKVIGEWIRYLDPIQSDWVDEKPSETRYTDDLIAEGTIWWNAYQKAMAPIERIMNTSPDIARYKAQYKNRYQELKNTIGGIFNEMNNITGQARAELKTQVLPLVQSINQI